MANDHARLIAVKAAVGQTIHTAGWTFIKGIWANVIENAIQETLKEDDPTKAESKRQRARALQQGLKELFGAIEETQNIGEEEQPDWYAELGIMQPTESASEIEVEQ